MSSPPIVDFTSNLEICPTGLSQAALDELTATVLSDPVGESPVDDRSRVEGQVLDAVNGTPCAVGLSQAALDELTCAPLEVAEGNSRAAPDALPVVAVDAADKPTNFANADKPAELCFLLRRTRAFLGTSTAEALAAELVAKASPPQEFAPSTQDTSQNAVLGSRKKLNLPVGSPAKEGMGRDLLDQVATPNRRRRPSMRTGGQSPMGSATPSNTPQHGRV